MTVRFSNQLVAEAIQPFWAALQAGEFLTDASAIASHPKPAKLATNLVLRATVEQDLKRRYSPEQIAGRLRREFR